jgi:hypothetical protein
MIARCFLAITLLLAASAASADGRSLSVSVDSPFLAGKSAMDAYFAGSSGHPFALPVVRLEVDGVVVHDGPLEMAGSPKSHLYFGDYRAILAKDVKSVRLRFVVPSRHIDWSRTFDTRGGIGFIFTEGSEREPVSVEQLARTRYYR